MKTPSKGNTPAKKPVVKKEKRKKHWFTVQEDAQILRYLRENSDKKTKSEIAKNLSEILKLSSESIRDRIKRYYSKLVAAHQNAIENQASVIYFLCILINRKEQNFMLILVN